MTSILIVSHEKKIVEGIENLILQMSPDVDLNISGGTANGEIGTDVMDIIDKITECKYDDVCLFFDLGSGYLSSKMAVDLYEGTKNVEFMEYPLVEGAFVASICAGANQSITQIHEELKGMKIDKIPK